MVEEETEAKAFATKENIKLGKIVIINTSLMLLGILIMEKKGGLFVVNYVL